MISLLLSTALLAAEPCGIRLQAYSTYEDLENNRIVEKHSVFPVGEWSDASAFEGVLVSRSEGKDLKLVVELRRSLNGKAVSTSPEYPFVPWDRDAKSLFAKGFEPSRILRDASGVFTLIVKKGTETICRETHGISHEGSNP